MSKNETWLPFGANFLCLLSLESRCYVVVCRLVLQIMNLLCWVIRSGLVRCFASKLCRRNRDVRLYAVVCFEITIWWMLALVCCSTTNLCLRKRYLRSRNYAPTCIRMFCHKLISPNVAKIYTNFIRRLYFKPVCFVMYIVYMVVTRFTFSVFLLLYVLVITRCISCYYVY